MEKSLLTDNQRRFLSFFENQQDLYGSFYFSGGTCLSEYYLHHRFSEDLDFFSEKEFGSEDITLLLQSNKNFLSYSALDYQKSFNRNIYQVLYPDNAALKVEFTYFPFKRIETGKKISNMMIDSLVDIAVNKVFTIFQNPRGRDFFDLYMILHHEKSLTLEKLVLLAKNKFDFHIDYLQLGSQFIKVSILKDDPIMSQKIPSAKIEDFFLKEARLLMDKFIE